MKVVIWVRLVFQVQDQGRMSPEISPAFFARGRISCYHYPLHPTAILEYTIGCYLKFQDSDVIVSSGCKSGQGLFKISSGGYFPCGVSITMICPTAVFENKNSFWSLTEGPLGQKVGQICCDGYDNVCAINGLIFSTMPLNSINSMQVSINLFVFKMLYYL